MTDLIRRLNPGHFVVIFVVLVFVAACVFFAWRDHRAEDRCHDLGGRTWDSGQHCAIGVDRVINTHDRTWG